MSLAHAIAASKADTVHTTLGATASSARAGSEMLAPSKLLSPFTGSAPGDTCCGATSSLFAQLGELLGVTSISRSGHHFARCAPSAGQRSPRSSITLGLR